ncbi:MAG: hypothetical protein RLN75_06645 [Longimicrobiales bacterium]
MLSTPAAVPGSPPPRSRLPFLPPDAWTRLGSDLIPVAGVAGFGWDVHAALFVLSCEVIALAAALGWLFDHPRRSTARGVLLATLLMPVGLLMWVVLVKVRGDVPESVGGMIADLLPVTWPAVAGIVAHTIAATRRRMARARARGATIRGNDRILLHWLAGVAAPFGVFVAVAVVGLGRSLGAPGLAAVLMAKALADLAFGTLDRGSAPAGRAGGGSGA